MKKYKWNENSIAKWHLATFPNVSTADQRIKAMKEAQEFFTAKNYEERLRELADFYICNAALSSRYSDEGGRLVCLLIRECETYPWREINRAVQEKMEINLSRSWVLVDDEYRHWEP